MTIEGKVAADPKKPKAEIDAEHLTAFEKMSPSQQLAAGSPAGVRDMPAAAALPKDRDQWHLFCRAVRVCKAQWERIRQAPEPSAGEWDDFRGKASAAYREASQLFPRSLADAACAALRPLFCGAVEDRAAQAANMEALQTVLSGFRPFLRAHGLEEEYLGTVDCA